MSIRRYSASKDNTISSAFKVNLSDRGLTSNMGSSDILEIFSIFGQASSSSIEQSRILVQFPVSEIYSDRQAGKIPASGSVTFKLKMFNAEHNQTVPERITMSVIPLVKPWSEGSGLDMEGYLDIGPSNWTSASSTQTWQTLGGDFLSSDYINTASIALSSSQFLEQGYEDVDVDITPFIEQMIINEAGNSVPASGSIIFNESKPPQVGSVFKIYSYNGDYRVFQFSNASGSSGNTTFVVTGSTAASSSANLIDAINNSSISSSIAATGQGGDLTASLSQRVATFYGNTIISSSVDAATASVTSFAGGNGALNYGFVVKLSETQEDGSSQRSYYTKKFFARSSHHQLERPVIEVQWDDSIKDDRGNIIKSSSLAPADDNVNRIYFYNKIRGQMRDIPNTAEQPTVTGSHVLVQFVPTPGAAAETVVGPALDFHTANSTMTHTTASTTYIAAKRVSTGLYKAEFAYSGDSTQLRDVWTLRNIPGDVHFELSQENSGASGETAVDFSSVTNVTSSTPTFTGSSNFREVVIKITGLPVNNQSFTLIDNEDPAVTGSFVFKTNSDVFNNTSSLDSGKMIIGIQSATSSFDIAQRMKTAILSKLSMESETLVHDTGSDVYTQLYTGSLFNVNADDSNDYYEIPEYLTNITNLKPSYKKDEQATFRVYTRNKNWQPNVYTVATKNAQVDTIRDAYYRVKRSVDDRVIIDYSTGSSPSYSSLSYDASGSYFDLDMSILEPNYLYEISFLYKDGLDYVEQKEKFKFRVDS
tara:strand:- start:1818 stop:4103 length:2286 start_codon:yes stop_codon:yes gene_type:complete